ncbi:hypothetical protein QFC19_003306 [Naganishia cerealis]|uniref:Uncharacterized protein n=1 Tax=Naganishia cerealis TaxID=610337 RepID=A0ACC2W573_9TREE|nr:hypothetical protein QFC19_003306 [Naganishia cerealis]
MSSTHRAIAPTQWEYRLERSAHSDLDGILNAEDQKRISEWTPCTQFPTEVHLELMQAGIIPHPYKHRNEHKVQWVGKQHWEFRAKLDLGAQLNAHQVCELELEGLDTFVKVFLNGNEILTGNNHFLPYNVPLKPKDLRFSNELLLRFFPAAMAAKALEAEHGKVRAGSCNLGDPSRVYVRKMQACWRWDWGLELMTIGPDRPITLHIAKVKFDEIHTRAIVARDLSQRELKVDIKIENPLETPVSCHCVLTDGSSNEIVKEDTVTFQKRDLANVMWVFGADQRGEQLDHFSRNIGFRRAQLVQDSLIDQPGKTFLFEINGRRIFAGGSNWIPTDHILPMIEKSRYRALLELADFQFACGIYPAYPDFVKSVEKEAIANVKRLRHHPSLVLFCGNNEDYQQIRQWNIDESQLDPLPARKIYEDLLPKVVAALTDPQIAYHPGSPNKAADSWATDDPTQGDIHQWTVWAPPSNPWQNYDQLGGRFVSEFGMPSIPDIRTVDWWIDGDEKERYSQSKLMQQHNRAGSHERRFAVYMNELFRLTGDFATYIYHTQVLQAEAMAYAYRSWRRQWKGPSKEYCAGALVWQLNDSWPVSSWSIIDYFLRPKPAYYSIKRELAPVSVGIQRLVLKNRENDRPRQFYEYGAFQCADATMDIWAANGTMEVITCALEVSAYDVETGWTWSSGKGETVQLKPNSTTELRSAIPVPAPLVEQAADPSAPSGSVVIRAKLRSVQGEQGPKEEQVLASSCDWPQPYKFIDFSTLAEHCGLTAQITTGKKDESIIILSCEKPIKCLTLGLDEWRQGDAEVEFSDNGVSKNRKQALNFLLG